MVYGLSIFNKNNAEQNQIAVLIFFWFSRVKPETQSIGVTFAECQAFSFQRYCGKFSLNFNTFSFYLRGHFVGLTVIDRSDDDNDEEDSANLKMMLLLPSLGHAWISNDIFIIFVQLWWVMYLWNFSFLLHKTGNIYQIIL